APEQARPAVDAIPCLAVGGPETLRICPATVDARAGQAAYEALVLAANLALAGRIDGLVTAPLNKAALWEAGHHYPGHTELLAELCGVSDFAMMLYLPPDAALAATAGLGVVHVTLHMALREALAALSTPAVVVKIRLADQIMRTLKGARPSIGVAAVNPHAGEGGLFGDEESRIIEPAVAEAHAAGIEAVGPLPADTLMVRAAAGDFDAVVAMYHDQGHIALKLLGMHRAVNVTLGLPIVRTSVAHGTAFDLAWQKKANTSSMLEAVRVAAQLAGRRQ
ncbi:MAG TPA: 4-hydroxythreonine-4-phosphate dehydrogenase PdxA, partial [Pirellulales bacterium]|nr:4-hydroxythreonine-4-phosphate dehydrogenase PdxA [Pirellulales bacterium]